MADDGPVFILDEVQIRPGEASAYRTRFQADYLPGAHRRGMELVGAWQHPPFGDLPDLPTTLYYLWKLTDVAAWWKMRLSRKPDGSDERFDKHAYWRKADEATLSRKRTFLSHMDEGC